MALLRYVMGGLLLAGTAAAQDVVREARDLRTRAALHEHGRGVRQDFGEAYRLYCESALLGDALSAYSLGWMYFNGRGLSRQPGLAVGWFKRAAKAGDGYAARMLVRYAGIQPQDDPGCRPKPPVIPKVAVVPAIDKSPARQLIEGWVAQIAPNYSVDPDLVLAVIQAESGFDSAALSNKNAQGLMQLIPATAERFGVKDIWNPLENIKGGTAYLNWLLRHFSGNVEWALAAYNAGERTVEQYQGVPPYKETQNYVKRIMAAYPKTSHPVPPALADKS
ncbi:transglycosylase SLT domain-containing protein [Methylomagnum sp.]